MRSRRILQAVAAGLFLTLMGGCLWAPELDRVRKDIEKQLPGVTFKREFALTLGPVALSVAEAVVKLAPDTEEAAEYLRDIRDVTLAVYDVENLPQDIRVGLPRSLKRILARRGWEITVKTSEQDEFLWILCKTDDDAIKGLYVVVLDQENLVLVRAHGRLEALFKKAIREHAHIADPI